MIDGISHIALTVRDAVASARWYGEVLGFEQLTTFDAPDGAFRKVFLRLDGLPTRVVLTDHRDADGQGFDERRVGLDHLAFAVPSRAELDEWIERLDGHGVEHSEVKPSTSIPGAAVVVFRDPDGVQLEVYFDPTAR